MRGKRLGRGMWWMWVALVSVLWGGAAWALDAGQAMPAIDVKDLKGHRIDATRLRGKVVVVDFWASWCEPCRAELPVLERLYRTYGKRGLEVVAVSVDTKVDNVHGFLRELPLSFPVVHDAEHTVSKRFRPPTMPSSYVVDRNGVVRHVHRGFRAGDAARLEAQIKALLDQPEPAPKSPPASPPRN